VIGPRAAGLRYGAAVDVSVRYCVAVRH
jgi:hypothetical protein